MGIAAARPHVLRQDAHRVLTRAAIEDREVTNQIATSQIALPKAACDLVYATAGYESSVQTLSQVTLATDMMFADGSSLELATMTGTVANGLVASLTVAVSTWILGECRHFRDADL